MGVPAKPATTSEKAPTLKGWKMATPLGRMVARIALPVVATAAIGGAVLAGAATAAADNATSTANGPSVGSSDFSQGASAVAPKTDTSRTQRVSDPSTGGPSMSVPTVG